MNSKEEIKEKVVEICDCLCNPPYEAFLEEGQRFAGQLVNPKTSLNPLYHSEGRGIACNHCLTKK